MRGSTGERAELEAEERATSSAGLSAGHDTLDDQERLTVNVDSASPDIPLKPALTRELEPELAAVPYMASSFERMRSIAVRERC